MVDTYFPPEAHHAREGEAHRTLDDLLLAAVGRGEPEAEEAFVRVFQDRAYGVAAAILGEGSRAEGVARDALRAALLKPTSYDSSGGPVLASVLRITRDHARQTVRRHPGGALDRLSEERAKNFLEGLEVGPRRQDTPGIGNRSTGLLSALRQLPPEQRSAIALAAMYGYTAQEISEIEAIPLDAAKANIRSGLVTLRDLMHNDAVLGVD